MDTKKKRIKVASIIMGIIGYIVLFFPWYELTSEASILGYSASMSAGALIGWSAAGTSILGYALYILPGIAVAIDKIGKQQQPRTKAMFLGIVGVLEVICLMLVDSEMASYATENAGFGASASAGFSTLGGYSFAMVVYVITAIVGFVLMLTTPKTQAEE